jgi:hypothetical protein
LAPCASSAAGDLEVLRRQAAELEAALRAVPGAAHVVIPLSIARAGPSSAPTARQTGRAPPRASTSSS